MCIIDFSRNIFTRRNYLSFRNSFEIFKSIVNLEKKIFVESEKYDIEENGSRKAAVKREI